MTDREQTHVIRYKTVVNDYGEATRFVEIGDVCPHFDRAFEERVGRGALAFGPAGSYGLPQDEPAVGAVQTEQWPDGPSHELHPIDYCPFCGEEIALEETKRVREVKEEHTETVEQTKTVTTEVPIDDEE